MFTDRRLSIHMGSYGSPTLKPTVLFGYKLYTVTYRSVGPYILPTREAMEHIGELRHPVPAH